MHRKIVFLASTFICGLTLTLALMLLLTTTTKPVFADPGELYVAPGGNCGGVSPCYENVQAAVDAATPGDTIKVATGTYTDVQTRDSITQVVYVSKTVTLQGGWNSGFTIRDSSVYPTVLDAQGKGPVIHIASGAAPTVDGFTITGGDGTGVGPCGWSWVSGCGGGIYVNFASPVIANNLITGNIGSSNSDGYGWGGGIHVWYGSAGTQISNNTIVSNVASIAHVGEGGGISLFGGTALVENNRIKRNIGSTFSEGSGGGLNSHHSSPLVARNVISGNIGSNVAMKWGYGGGLYFQGGQPVLDSNQVLNNIANPSVTWHDAGGGLHLWASGPFILTNNIFAGNAASHYGSGIWIQGYSVTNGSLGSLVNNTIVQNGGGTGGEGIWVGEYSVVTVTNNIIVSQTIGITNSCPVSSVVTARYNLFWANNSDPVTGSDAVLNDPVFVGGGDYHITSGSAALNAGVDAGVTTDIDGEARPFGIATDIGADERATVGTTAEPATASAITSTVGGLTTTVQIPTGAVTESTALTYTALAITGQSDPTGFSFAGHAFDLDAYQSGVIVSGFTFSVPVTVTLHYADADIAGLDEDSLVLEYWNGSAWVDAACGDYDRHPTENWLSVPICHLSQFALFGEREYLIYLPLVLRNS